MIPWQVLRTAGTRTGARLSRLAGSVSARSPHPPVARVRRGAITAVLVVSVVLGLVLGGTLVLSGPAGASDNPGLLNFDPREVTAGPGETVEIDVLLRAAPQPQDDGVIGIEYTIAYDDTRLEADEVTIGPWLDGEDTTVESDTEIDGENGEINVQQWREPPGDGESDTGETPTAIVTFDVRGDAPPGEAEVTFASGEAQLHDHPLRLLTTRETVITVPGDGDASDPDRRESLLGAAGVIGSFAILAGLGGLAERRRH